MKHFCLQTVGVLSDKSIDSYGRERWNDAVYYKGRYSEKITRVIDVNGEETLSDGIVYFYKDVPIDVNYNIKVGSTQYRVMAVDKPRDSFGNETFYKVYIKKVSV